ncbi:MAG: glutathione S-transferase family protein [Tildeniella torsiva UHER 1998/13D]|jgi:glutathione S-transferase|nr:glutathione S-transferase family protein [Tildeniella torsiva UHER 1998/13D]
MPPILHGFAVSPYVRAARIALIEKGVDYQFNEVGFDALKTADYARLNPFRKMPVLEQGDFVLYETPAILGYIDEALGQITLQPVEAQARARMRQWMSIAAHYLYPVGVMQLFVQRIMAPIMGGEPDESVVAEAVTATEQHLDVLEQALVAPFLAGETLSLADLLTGAMVHYIALTREGSVLVVTRPKTAAWLGRLSQRESFRQTLAALLESKAQG